MAVCINTLIFFVIWWVKLIWLSLPMLMFATVALTAWFYPVPLMYDAKDAALRVAEE
jgi:hypothetical protein